MKSVRLIYLDVLRIAATFSVIILHTASSQVYSTPVDTFDWQVFNIYHSLVSWCVPMFLMLSSVIFLDNKKNISRKDMYGKYIKRILTALVFWGLLYGFSSLFAKKFISHEVIAGFEIIAIFEKLLFGPAWYHLWYLYLIIGIYILTPLFRVFISHSTKKDLEYLLILFFLSGLVLPMVNKALSMIDQKYVINFSIVELTGYVGYYFAGYYFSKNEISKKLKIVIYILGILSIIITILLTARYSLLAGEQKGYLYGYLLPTTMFSAFAIFILFKDMFKSIYLSDKLKKIIIYSSNCTFGIYLAHDFIIQAYTVNGLTTKAFNPVFSVPLLSIVNICISILVVSIIKKIPVLKNYIT